MLTKTIKYTDFLGVERKEDFMFNLSETELTQMELKTAGQLTNKLRKLVDSPDIPMLLEMFDLIIESSYGILSADGREFVKGKDIYDHFRFTNAYDKLITELLSDDKIAVEFIKGVMPSSVVAAMEEEEQKKQLEETRDPEGSESGNDTES